MRHQCWSVVFLMLLCPGCITGTVWSAADETALPFMGIDGSARPGPGPREFLVARYGTGDDARLVRVPLDADGRPLPPFDWGANPVAPSTVALPSVPVERQAELDRAAVPSRAGRRDLTRVIPADSPFLYATSDTMVMTTYRLTPDGRVHPYAVPLATPGKAADDLPKGVYAVLLPANRPVDPARRRLHVAQAVALTPLTLMADTATDLTIAAPFVALYALDVWAGAGFPTDFHNGGNGGDNASGKSYPTHPHREHAGDDANQ